MCSRSVKELRESISGAQLDAGDLEQQQQHLRRQLATLADRIKRLESQVCLFVYRLLCFEDGFRPGNAAVHIATCLYASVCLFLKCFLKCF